MKKYFPLTLVWLLLPGCVNQENVEKEFQNVKNQYPVNAFLTQDIPLYSVKPNQGTIVLQASFKEQQEIRKIAKGSWCHYLYKITYDHIRILEGCGMKKKSRFFAGIPGLPKNQGLCLRKQHGLLEVMKISFLN